MAALGVQALADLGDQPVEHHVVLVGRKHALEKVADALGPLESDGGQPQVVDPPEVAFGLVDPGNQDFEQQAFVHDAVQPLLDQQRLEQGVFGEVEKVCKGCLPLGDEVFELGIL